MYNAITEEKIRQIPSIGDIDINRLPQELTRIYAQIISLRRQVADGTINFQFSQLQESLDICRTLANNLETILITYPNHIKKESIAFVAATTHSLIQKLSLPLEKEVADLQTDTISPLISGVILFLIGNSQADAAELCLQLANIDGNSVTQHLAAYIKALASGNLMAILNNPLTEQTIDLDDLQQSAVDCLWREIGIGIYRLARRLMSRDLEDNVAIFDRVIDLSVSEDTFWDQSSCFTGPFHLAKLLKILESDILIRGVINIKPPAGVDQMPWYVFLEKLALDRPYLWENHKSIVNDRFLDPGISAVLTLPTGAGKSTLSELKIASCLYSGRNVVYLVPTHALEDQVGRSLATLFTDFKPEQSEFDGEYTDFEYVDDFPIQVMTPERCLTMLNITPELFANVGLIIYDEFHLISGTSIYKERRAVDAMYCLLALFSLKPDADYLLISAMVENGEEIAEWIGSVTGRECNLFNSSWKPTRQLHGCLVFEENKVKALNNILLQARIEQKKGGPTADLKRKMLITPQCFFSLKNIWETTNENDYFRIPILPDSILLGLSKTWRLTTNRNDVAAKLAIHFAGLGLKTLVFVDDPRIARSVSDKISVGLNGRFNGYADFLNLNSIEVESLRMELGDVKHSYFHQHDNVGVHHGLLFPIERNLIEKYFKKKDGSVALVATATLAQGINLPAEIVIIAGDDRFNEDTGYRERVAPHELLNAAGRAGRAGQSSQGAVILIPGDIVTIKDSVISNRWWALKNEVFSKSDQCLKIADPLQHFLDSIQNDAEPLDSTQIDILYRFKAGNLSVKETKNLLNNSFYAFRAAKAKESETFGAQVNMLVQRRNELDALSKDVGWTKEISFKTGIDPSLILELSNAIDLEDFDSFSDLSVTDYIKWFFNWLAQSPDTVQRVYTKPNTIAQIKKAMGLTPDKWHWGVINQKLPDLMNLVILYVNAATIEAIDKVIPGPSDPFLKKARNFVIRLIPEISFSFGLLAMVIIEKAEQRGIKKHELSWNIRALASCVREGFDHPKILFFKRDKKILTRVDAHAQYLLT